MRIPVAHRALGRFLLAAGVLWSLVPAPVSAKRAPDHDPAAAALRAQAPPVLYAEALTSGNVMQGVQKQYGTQTGTLRRLYLREPLAYPASSSAPLEVAREFLRGHATELGLAADFDSQLKLAYGKESPSGTHFRYDQRVGDVPVYRSEIVVKVNKRGQVSSVQNNVHPGLSLGTTPTIDAKRAVDIAERKLGITGKELGPSSATLHVVPFDGGARLAYVAIVANDAPMGDWRVFVDAKTGAVIGVVDEMRYADGSGRVFDPDPRSKMGDSTFVDAGDADSAVPFTASYDIRPLLGITNTAGTYSLDGPFARLIDNEAPTFAPVTATHPDSFRYQRNAQGFEDVHCYYHIDANQRYIQSLGFLNINNRVQQIDSHGLSGADNSHYVPSTKNIAFGEGGVDDAEDADIVLHEYGHSIQDNIVPGWGGGQEGAMGEGFGDYWSGSYSIEMHPGFQPLHFATWDGNGETWTGRLHINTALHYPENCCGQVHASGTLWCSGLMDCRFRLGRNVMDRIVLDHHFALGTTATMADAANQVIQSDIDLFGGAHLGTLVARFGFWGFVNPANFIPTITHTPLSDTENTAGPYVVNATVTSTQPLTGDSPKLFWGFGASITDSVLMTPGVLPAYAASIPGPGVATDVRYYIRAADTNGGVAFSPVTAPATPNVFHVGPDVTPPTLTHNPLGNQPEITWPAALSATVTDNLGVASVVASWALNAVPQANFTLNRVGVTNTYTNFFPSNQAQVNPGDVITYHIVATDAASTPNTRRSPASGEHTFTITSALGTVLVLDDDEVAKRSGTKVVEDDKHPGQFVELRATGDDAGVSSANDIAAILNGLGYVASIEPANTSNPASWTTYSFIVSSSGASLSPVANATYRANLEAYVAGGGKLLVEGGEVAFDAAGSPIYPTFTANVLHTIDWDADNAGALVKLAAQSGHPIANVPNVLPATLPIAYAGFGDEDSYKPTGGAYIVYGVTAQPGNGGILVYDNNLAPQSAQIVFLGFNLKKLGTATDRTNLIQNVAAFLTAQELPADARMSGRVALGAAWAGAGITVTAQPGNLTTTTDAAGEFSFNTLYPLVYSVSVAQPGYQSASVSNIVLGPAGNVTGIKLQLIPQSSTNQCAQPALAIPDNNPTGVSTNMTVVPAFAVQGVKVSLNLTHTYRGDLIVEVRHGAKTVRLHNQSGGSADNIIGTYPTTLAVDGPGALSDFIGDPSAGTWTLFVSDNANLDVGTVNEWCLEIAQPADSSQVVGVGSGAVTRVSFARPVPNPTGPQGTTLQFALPRAAHVDLAIYDVTGRKVRSLVHGVSEAGVHALGWSGRADDGRRVAPGIYLVKLVTPGFSGTQRLVLVQ